MVQLTLGKHWSPHSGKGGGGYLTSDYMILQRVKDPELKHLFQVPESLRSCLTVGDSSAGQCGEGAGVGPGGGGVLPAGGEERLGGRGLVG